MAYDVRTPVYEGPFEMLLHLILQEEVDLWELSLTDLVDSFLRELEAIGSLDLDVATQFLLVASTLIELKARRLLPGTADAELDEELMRFEERDLLLSRLLACKTFKDVAAMIEGRLATGAKSVARSAGPEEPFRSLAPDPLLSTTLAQFRAAAIRAFAPKEEIEQVVDLFHVQPLRTSVREAIDAVLIVLPQSGAVSFRVLVAGIEDRLEVIVRFLAVLELFKQGVLDLTQIATFGDLSVRRLAEGEQVLDRESIDDWEDSDPKTPIERSASDRRVIAALDAEKNEAVDAGLPALVASGTLGALSVELDVTPEAQDSSVIDTSVGSEV
jgi:segregation and condensation protein A